MGAPSVVRFFPRLARLAIVQRRSSFLDLTIVETGLHCTMTPSEAEFRNFTTWTFHRHLFDPRVPRSCGWLRTGATKVTRRGGQVKPAVALDGIQDR